MHSLAQTTHWPNAGYPVDNRSELAEICVMCILTKVLAGTLSLALCCWSSALTLGRPVQASDSTPGLEVIDDHGRSISQQGLVLVDWEGYIANAAVKFYLVPPPGGGLPRKGRPLRRRIALAFRPPE